MKKVSTAAAKQSRNISQPTLTIGLDLGDRNSWYCVLDEVGQIRLEQPVRTNAKALFDRTPSPVPGCPACEPNLIHCRKSHSWRIIQYNRIASFRDIATFAVLRPRRIINCAYLRRHSGRLRMVT